MDADPPPPTAAAPATPAGAIAATTTSVVADTSSTSRGPAPAAPAAQAAQAAAPGRGKVEQVAGVEAVPLDLREQFLFELGPGDRPRRDPPHDLRRFLLHVHRPAAQRPYHALDLPAVQKAVAVSVEDVEDVAEADVVDLRTVVPRVVVVGVLRDVP